eukprot:12586-Heterococcus_DN1.PRE.4
MDAFQQRKDRTEQRKYAKEVGAERAKEKAARKKDALAAVDQWRKDSKAKGGGALPDDDGLDGYLAGNKRQRTDNSPGGANKRAAKDKKYGHGGVPGRLKKQATSKSINDMRGFNPKQGKTGAKKGGKANAGANRPGKAVRQKSRARNLVYADTAVAIIHQVLCSTDAQVAIYSDVLHRHERCVCCCWLPVAYSGVSLLYACCYVCMHTSAVLPCSSITNNNSSTAAAKKNSTNTANKVTQEIRRYVSSRVEGTETTNDVSTLLY